MENSSATTPFLIFELGISLFAVQAQAVREVVPLPEVTPLEEARGYIAGLFTLHGRIVPVIDLNLRFGHLRKRWEVTDCIVVVEWAGSLIGIAVNEVMNVCNIPMEDVAPVPAYAGHEQPDRQFLTGLFNLDGSLVALLHLENLLTASQGLRSIRDGEQVTPAQTGGVYPEATVQERALFRQRANDLAALPEDGDEEGVLPLAVIRMSGELFGVELSSIREFAEMLDITPIPCCPPHVVGQVNLRGDLITLIEVTTVLGLRTDRGQTGRKIVVLNIAELRVGVLVDDVQDVIYLRGADLELAASRATPELGRTYLQGAVPYESRMLTLLNIALLMMHESLLVNENP